MLMMPMTEQEALKWIAVLFEESDNKLQPATTREEIAAWDSLGMLTLMAGMNEKFDIVMSDDELQKFRTVEDILNVLRKNGKLA
jgi:acyl carrier protein